MSTAERIFQVFVGFVLTIAGIGIIYAFHSQDLHKNRDIWDGGYFLLAEAYSIIGSLFILLGLRYAIGSRNFIEQWIANSLRRFAVVVVLLSLAVLASIIFNLI